MSRTMNEKEKRLLNQLKKYEKKQPGEVYRGFEVGIEKYRLGEKIRFVQHVKEELNLTNDDVSQIIYIIRSVNDLRRLYRGIKWETIILAICVVVKEKNSKKLLVFRNHRIIKRYKLTLRIYSTVASRLWQFETKNKAFNETDFLKASTNQSVML